MRVPLIANWPGRIAEGRVLDDLVDSTDFLPTICDAAGIERPQDLTLDGHSFLPQLLGQKGAPREWIYCWYAREGGATPQAEFAMNNRYKLYSQGRMFDLVQDPEEQRPLDTTTDKPEVTAARRGLNDAIQRFQGVRPAAIVAQAGPNGDDRNE